jgi:hypothetical protein
MPYLNMNNHASRDHQLHFRILRMMDMKEVLPQVEIGVDP